MTGIELITRERKEQIEKHGFTVVIDAQEMTDTQLSGVATFLCIPDYKDYGLKTEEDYEKYRPQNWNKERFYHMVKKPYKQRLIIAGALIAAEIDRLNINEN